MTDEKFEYESKNTYIWYFSDVLDVSTINGLECVLHYASLKKRVAHIQYVRFSWKFNYDVLKKRGIKRLTGYIILKPSSEDSWFFDFVERKIDVDLKESNQTIEKYVNVISVKFLHSVKFEYSLIPHYTQIEEAKQYSSSVQNNSISVVEDKNDTNEENLSSAFDEMSLSSEQNDAILVVDEKKIHVNKSFLSHHSEFFRNLFSLNDKDEKLNEIPIEEISVEDFKFLLSSFSTKPVFPTDETVEKLLKLADRFKVPSVIHHCEHHLLDHSNIENEKMMWLGEKYGMSDLLEKSILKMNTMEKVKKWKLTPEYISISNDTKGRVLDRLT